MRSEVTARSGANVVEEDIESARIRCAPLAGCVVRQLERQQLHQTQHVQCAQRVTVMHRMLCLHVRLIGVALGVGGEAVLLERDHVLLGRLLQRHDDRRREAQVEGYRIGHLIEDCNGVQLPCAM